MIRIHNKLIFLDLDGTLLGMSRKLHPDTRAALLEAQALGNRIYLSSGRPPKYLQTGICREFPFDGMVACAGGCVYAGDQLLFENRISPALLNSTLDLFRSHGISWQFDTRNGTYTTQEMERDFVDAISIAARLSKEWEENFRKEQESLFLNGVNHPMREWTEDIFVQKIIFTSRKKSVFHAIREQLEEDFVINVFFESENALSGELIPLTCTKEHGIRRILEYTGASWEDTVAFGDSRNDLEMLQAVHTKVAAVYAPKELTSIADYLFEDPDQGGIAKVLRNLK